MSSHTGISTSPQESSSPSTWQTQAEAKKSYVTTCIWVSSSVVLFFLNLRLTSTFTISCIHFHDEQTKAASQVEFISLTQTSQVAVFMFYLYSYRISLVIELRRYGWFGYPCDFGISSHITFNSLFSLSHNQKLKASHWIETVQNLEN